MSAASPLPAQLDIAIVGAGAAGLGAARRLASARRLGGPGFSVAVLEARDRIGGRAHTVYHDGMALDLGCGWLHSADRNVLARLGRRAGFVIDETPPPWGRPAAFGLGLSPAEQAEFGAAFRDFDDRVAEAAVAGQDRPAADLFEPGSRWTPRMDAISGALNGARFAEVSTLDHDRYEDSGVNWRVMAGYGRMVAELGGAARVVLDCPVTRIDRSGPTLRLDTARGTVEARVVILTLPTSLIAREAIRIDPPVPALLEAVSGAPLGLASKLHLAVEGPDDFPAESQLWGKTDTAETAGYHLRPFGRPLIEAYVGGDLAWGLDAEGGDAFLDFAVEELVGLLGSDMRRRLSAVAVSAWGSDPWSLGAYSHCLPGQGDARARLKAPIEDRIFVAGEATSEPYYGTAHGAWAEGERAADQALAALGLPLPEPEAF